MVLGMVKTKGGTPRRYAVQVTVQHAVGIPTGENHDRAVVFLRVGSGTHGKKGTCMI